MQNKYRYYKGAWIYAQNLHEEQKLSEKEVRRLLRHKGIMVRNVYDFDTTQETSFWYVIKDSFGGMEELSSKMRNQVKRCFKTMRVEKISAEYLLENGYEVFVQASENYRIKSVPPTINEFKERILNGSENEFWGVIDIDTNKLVAFSMNTVTPESCEYRTMKAIPKYQKLYAYYGLIYEMNRYYLDERKVMYVNDGARSITNHSNIQPFLIDKFNFRKAYCHLDMKYKWWLNLAVKCLYPFRKNINIRQIRSFLDMEAMARGQI